MKIFFSSLFAFVVLAGFSRAEDLLPLETKVMLRGYCYAGSRRDERAIGGYASSANAPQEVTEKTPGTADRIDLVALPAEPVTFQRKHQGFRLLLINRTGEEASFNASDAQLTLLCEARDRDGAWKAIEARSVSFCGNSFHHVYLPAGHYWEFAAPVYGGPFQTKLRYRFQAEYGKGSPVYSNEFDGHIHLSQFDSLDKPPAPKSPPMTNRSPVPNSPLRR